MLKAYLKNLLLPSSASVMKSFTSAIKSLDAKAAASDALADELYEKYHAAQKEATASNKFANKLRQLVE